MAKLYNKNTALLEYEGVFRRGKLNGQGTYFNKFGRMIYTGNFKDGSYDGQGKLYKKNMCYYIGNFKDGYEQGKGILYHKNGKKKYDGEFVDG